MKDLPPKEEIEKKKKSVVDPELANIVLVKRNEVN